MAIAVPRPGSPPPAPGTPPQGAYNADTTALQQQVNQYLPNIWKTLGLPNIGHQQAGRSQTDKAKYEAALTSALREAGVRLPDGMHVSANGLVTQDPSWWSQWGPYVMMGVAAGTAGLGSYLGWWGPGASGGSTAVAGGDLADVSVSTTPIATGGTAGGTLASVLSNRGTTAVTGGTGGVVSDLVKNTSTTSGYEKLLTSLLTGGLDLALGYLGRNAAQDASKAQVDALNRALDFSKQVYQQNLTNQAPWLAYGRGAVTQLGDLMGVKPDFSFLPSGVPQPPSGPYTPSGYGPSGPTGGYTPPGSTGPGWPGPGGSRDLGNQRIGGLPVVRLGDLAPSPPAASGGPPVSHPMSDPSSAGVPSVDPLAATPGPSGPPPSSPISRPMAQYRGSGQMVRVQLPDGSTAMVPPQIADTYQRLGARVMV